MPSDSYILKRSLLISFVERYFLTILQFITVMILARLLTPEDIGIYTVGVAVIGVTHAIRDFGIGMYLIQEKDLDKEKVATALGLTFCIAWFMGVIVLCLAPYLANYYDEAAVGQVINVVALNFFIIPFGAMAPALLKRSMSFGTLFKISLCSKLVSVSVSISLAFAGYGFMCMAWASVANALVVAVLAQFYLPKKFRTLPGLKNAKRILKFGSHVVGANLVRQIEMSFLDLWVGKVLGFPMLGYLSRGQGYVKIYSNVIGKAIGPVIHAHLALKNRNDEQLENSFSYIVSYVTLVGWFFLGFMGLMSFNVIRVLYGDQWDIAVPMASILCLTAAIQVPIHMSSRLLNATGKVKIIFWLSLTLSSLRILMILLLVNSGLETLLLGFSAVSVLHLAAIAFFVFSLFKFHLSTFLAILVKNLAIVVLSLLLPIYFRVTQDYSGGYVFELLAGGVVSCSSWLALVYLSDHPLKKEIEGMLSAALSRLRAN